MSRFSLTLALALTPFLPSCIFLLDFDQIEKDPPSAGGGGNSATAGTESGGMPSGGTTSTGGTSAGAGQGGSGGATCDEDCNDDDPCTEDECVDGQCQWTPVTGLISTGFSQGIQFQRVTGTTLVGGEDRYYLAVHGDVAEGSVEARMWSVDPAADDVTEAQSSFNGLAGGMTPRTPVALTTTNEDEFQLHAYFPFGDSQDPNVLPVVFDANMFPTGDNLFQAIAIPNDQDRFRVVSPSVGPSAATLPNGEPFVVWPSAAGLAFYQYDKDLMADHVTRVPTPFSVTNVDAVPLNDRMAAVFSAVGASGDNQIHMAFVGATTGTAILPVGCTENGDITRIDAEWLGTSLNGSDIVGLTWSESVGIDFVTHSASIRCSATSCEASSTCGMPGAEDIVVEVDADFVARAAEPDVLYQPTANSIVQPNASAVIVALSKVGIGGTTAQNVGQPLVARSSIDAERRPLLHVQIATLGEDGVLATWVSRRAGSPDVVGMEGFQICFPEQ